MCLQWLVAEMTIGEKYFISLLKLMSHYGKSISTRASTHITVKYFINTNIPILICYFIFYGNHLLKYTHIFVPGHCRLGNKIFTIWEYIKLEHVLLRIS